MDIKLNKYNYVVEYSTVGGLGGSITVSDVLEADKILDHQYIDGKFIYNPIPKKKPKGIKMMYNGKKWIEEASIEEQKKYYKNLIIKKNRERIELEDLEFPVDEIVKELNELKDIYKKLSHVN